MDKKQLLEDKFMTAARFSQEVEKIAFDNPEMNYIDSVIHYCELNEIELDSVNKLISKPLKEKLRHEAQQLNFMKKTSRAKLMLVKGDIQEMMELQQFCFRSAMNFILLNKDRKLEYFEALETLIEKQKIFYARAKLSEDPEAKSVVDTMKQGIIMLGATPDTSIEKMFTELLDKVQNMKKQTEAQG